MDDLTNEQRELIDKSMIQTLQELSIKVFDNPITYQVARKLWLEAYLLTPKPATPQDILMNAFTLLEQRNA